MRVLIICSSIARDVGGPARSIQGLAAALERIGVETHLLSLKPLDEPWVEGISHYRTAGKFGFRGVRAAVEKAIDEIHPDIIHIQNIWMLNLHMAAVAARHKQIPYVLSLRGAISKWALSQSRWKKRLALLTYQGHDFNHAAALHATSEFEAERIRDIGYGHKTILVCPNGVNLPLELPEWERPVGRKRKMLFLSRIHKVKGLVDLVQAWAKLNPKDWILEIVGNDEDNYWPVVQSEINRLGIGDKIIRTDFLPDEQKWVKYRQADCFVLPSYSENFGIVVAEALYAGLPVITTKGTPWKDLEECKCGYWIDVGVGSLVDALSRIVALPDEERSNMGARGHKLIKERYTWDGIAKQLKLDYEELLK